MAVLAIDMDGVLCEGEAYTTQQCLDAKPRQEVIAKAKEEYNHNFIVIYTARRDNLIPATIKWLRMHGVPFHAISNNKMAADWYIDDKCTNVKDWG